MIERLKEAIECYSRGMYVTPRELAGLLLRIEDGTITNASAKIVFEEMWRIGKERARRLSDLS